MPRVYYFAFLPIVYESAVFPSPGIANSKRQSSEVLPLSCSLGIP